MTPDASGWRSSAGYDHVEDLTASDLAWEWLRRNDAYDHDFEALAHADADPQKLTDKIRQHWGLRFPGRSFDCSSRRSRILASATGYERRHTCERARAVDGRHRQTTHR